LDAAGAERFPKIDLNRPCTPLSCESLRVSARSRESRLEACRPSLRVEAQAQRIAVMIADQLTSPERHSDINLVNDYRDAPRATARRKLAQ
jgi:hypothetical protein